MFVLSFKNGNDNSMRDSFDKYYMPLVEIKDFKDQRFFGQSVKDKKRMKNLSRNNDYLKANLLDFSYHKIIIGIDLSRQRYMGISQWINFTEKLEEDEDGAAMFFITEKQKKLFKTFL